MANQNPDWDRLTTSHGGALVKAVRRHLISGLFEITARELATEVNCRVPEATAILETLATDGLVSVSARYACPCDQRRIMTGDAAAQEVCGQCNHAFTDVGGLPERIEVYRHDSPRTRDVRWMLALHGMNTDGAWQEAFNWLVSRTYGYSVPVAIYKYGTVRPGAVIKFRQRALARQLDGRIRRLSGETEESGFGGRPDVIAHSLGTWMLGHALRDNANLRVGRVILTGSILRPDFNWTELIGRGQVESVLCHVATYDFWAGIAHYVIPDSGPSGRRGFNDRANVSHVTHPDRGHSDFFKEGEMPALFKGVWQPFLTQPGGLPAATTNALPPPNWKQVCWPFRATLLRLFLLGLFGLIFAAVAAAVLFGLVDLWRLLLR